MPLVLLTGSTGFVGAPTLRLLLADGYTVRAAIRDMSKADHIKKQHPEKADHLEFVEVRDMMKPDAFMEAAKGVDYIVHVASPFLLKVKSNRKDLIDPAIDMTNAILNAAQASPSVKRIVFTSSFATILDPVKGIKCDYEYTSESRSPLGNRWNILGNKTVASLYSPLAYTLSKVLAELAIWDYIKSKKPHFDAVTLHPPYIFGKLEQAVSSPDQLNESTRAVYQLLDAKTVPKDVFPPYCDVEDVAKAHVLALTNPKASNQRYLLCGGDVSWQKVCDEVHKNYPQIADRIPVGNPGADTLPKPLARLNVSKAEQDLGIVFTGWKESVIDHSLLQLAEMPKS